MINKLSELKQLCIEDRIPFLKDNALDFLIKTIKENNIKNVLEIGTAYGYSSLSISPFVDSIVTLEKNENNWQIAQKFISKNTESFLVDAFEFETTKFFDLIFIDGPKSNQKILFEKYSKYIDENGLIFIDNMFMKKFKNQTELTKNQSKLLQNVEDFREWLLSLKEWDVTIYDIDDGIAICKKRI